MRLRTSRTSGTSGISGILVIILALGLAAYAVVRRTRRRARRAARDAEARAEYFARRGGFASDPGDPVQGFDEASELEGTPLDVDAQPEADAQAAQDLVVLEAALEAEPDIVIIEPAPGTMEAVIELEEQEIAARHGRGDDGDLYGGHTPPAADRTHPDDDQAFAEGQTWTEALETSAVELGPEPDRELDIVDDEDVLRPPHPSTGRDIPIADLGAGGRRGL